MLTVWITRFLSDTADGPKYKIWGEDGFVATDHSVTGTIHRVFAVTAGTHLFTFAGEQFTGSTVVSDVAMTCMFIPAP